MQISALINIVALAAATVFWMMCFVIFYHLARFGVGTIPKRLAALFLVGSVGLFLWGALSYMQLDLSILAISL